MTPTERRRPWILYLTPGLLAALGLQIVYVGLGLGTVRHLLLPELTQPGLSSGEDVPLIRLAIFIVLSLASTVVLTPLDVISTRLSIQRNHTTPEINSVPREEGDAEVAVEYTGINEDVIRCVLKFSQEPFGTEFNLVVYESSGNRTVVWLIVQTRLSKRRVGVLCIVPGG